MEWLQHGLRGGCISVLGDNCGTEKKGGSSEVVGVVSVLRFEEWRRRRRRCGLQRWLLFWDLGQLRRKNGGSVTVAVGNGLKANQDSLKGCVFAEGGES